MAYRSMYCYAWDLAEDGVRRVADELQARHFNSLTLAGSYHAGKFLRPHGKHGKVYFPEDGTAYFKTDPDRYGKIRPRENRLLAETDIFDQCCRLGDMQISAWMVLLHNSLLGQIHPDCCVSNAFGDRYIYNLCPSAPAVRDYAIALCTDIADRYPIDGLNIETPGFLPYVHGYHHEFALVRQNSWLNNLLGLCFCEDCIAGATACGVDAKGLRRRVSENIEAYLATDIDFPEDMAAAFWNSDLLTDPDLSAFFNWRCTVVETLVSEIRASVRKDAVVSIIPSVARPTSGAWYEGSDIGKLAEIADHLEVCFYEPGPERVACDLYDVTRRCGGTTKLRGILRPGYPDLTNREQVVSAVRQLAAGGVSDIAFYNYGHLRKPALDWAGEALSTLEVA